MRLPSEAEWEYAERGPESWIYPWGNEPQPNPERANYKDTNLGATSAVGCFPRGASLFSDCEEMAGNVWEWCLDVWHDNYEDAPTDGSARTSGGSRRVLRGGSWCYEPRGVRSALRNFYAPSGGNRSIGFRLARTDF